MNWIIDISMTFNVATIAAGLAAIVAIAAVWSAWLAHRVKKQLLDVIGLLDTMHNDRVRHIARRERKMAALRALDELNP